MYGYIQLYQQNQKEVKYSPSLKIFADSVYGSSQSPFNQPIIQSPLLLFSLQNANVISTLILLSLYNYLLPLLHQSSSLLLIHTSCCSNLLHSSMFASKATISSIVATFYYYHCFYCCYYCHCCTLTQHLLHINSVIQPQCSTQNGMSNTTIHHTIITHKSLSQCHYHASHCQIETREHINT